MLKKHRLKHRFLRCFIKVAVFSIEFPMILMEMLWEIHESVRIMMFQKVVFAI